MSNTNGPIFVVLDHSSNGNTAQISPEFDTFEEANEFACNWYGSTDLEIEEDQWIGGELYSEYHDVEWNTEDDDGWE